VATVFDPLLEQRQALPAAVEAAQREHREALERQTGAPDGDAPAP
jgi:hypothetical protein